MLLVEEQAPKNLRLGTGQEVLGSVQYSRIEMRTVARRPPEQLRSAGLALVPLPQCRGVRGGASFSSSEAPLLPLYPTHSSEKSVQPLMDQSAPQPVLPFRVGDQCYMRIELEVVEVVVVLWEAGSRMRRRTAIVGCWERQLRNRHRAAEGRDREENRPGAAPDRDAEAEIDWDRRGLRQERLPGRGIDSSSGP